jgi:hypothetical protein
MDHVTYKLNGKAVLDMMKAKSLAAGAIALTVALGGGALWAGAGQHAYAAPVSSSAASTSSATATPAPKAADGTQTKPEAGQKGRAHGEHGGKRGGPGLGIAHIQQQLAVYLGLTEAELRTKLEAETLAEVAAAQGKTRETLKAQLIEWLEAAQAERAAKTETDAAGTDTGASKRPAFDASAAADKLLDSQGVGKRGSDRSSGKDACGERPNSASTDAGTVTPDSTTSAS